MIRNASLLRRPLLLATLLACVAAGAGALAPEAAAQDSMMRPFGMDNASYSDPFYAPARDNAGVRVVVNGRPADLQDRSGGYQSSFGQSRFARSGVSGGPTLRQTTLAATAVGNSVSVSNVSNSTIFVQSYNAGNQIAVVNGRGN